MYLPPNPHVPWAWLTINGTEVTIDETTKKPRHLESFTCDFKVETIGTFEFVLFDPEYDRVEELIAKSNGQCTFQFGYVYPDYKSSPYEGFILSYTPEFLRDGIRIHLAGMTMGLKLSQKQLTKGWADKRISDIVEQIAKDNGFETTDDNGRSTIDKTTLVNFREGLESTEFFSKTWHQSSTAWSFVIEQLQRQAVKDSDKKEGGFVFYIEEGGKSGKPILHFHPPRYDEDPPEAHKFIWRDKKTSVISFSPNYNGNLLATMLMGGTTQQGYTSAENVSIEGIKLQNVETKDQGTGTAADGTATQTRSPVSKEENEPTARNVKFSPTDDMAENESKFWWYRYAWLASFTGELVVVGDPKLRPFKMFDIVVEKATGGNHWTSGKYWSQGIQHTIQGGEYTTTVHLWRDGAPDGEMANPRVNKG
jgi:hypothetical protein